ncbi:MAG: Cof-type HAD-IIB family hydrolase [Mycoplasma sp.]|nr:Cof-type HAD-IIB family hydrolase [Mycoplasma sp.]
MTSRKKLFAFDLDGTLLNSKMELSNDNIEALIAAKNAGHVLVMATGRNYIYSQISLKEHWGLFDYYIGCNGAIIHSIHERDVITNKDNKIPFDFIMEIIHEVRKIGGTVQVSTEWDVFVGYYLNEENSVIPKSNKERFFDPYSSVFDMEEKDKKSIVQISVHLEEHNIRKYWELWNKSFGDKYELTITSKHNIDINLIGISKLSAIKEIVKLENILYEDVFVFGDSQNDIKGLEYYNNTYAMENALWDAKQAAKHIIGDNNSKDISKIVMKNI